MFCTHYLDKLPVTMALMFPHDNFKFGRLFGSLLRSRSWVVTQHLFGVVLQGISKNSDKGGYNVGKKTLEFRPNN